MVSITFIEKVIEMLLKRLHCLNKFNLLIKNFDINVIGYDDKCGSIRTLLGRQV